jgi:hypothetical protein
MSSLHLSRVFSLVVAMQQLYVLGHDRVSILMRPAMS